MKNRGIKVRELTKDALGLISRTRLEESEKEKLIQDTVKNFREHLNPGFLEYRKSVSTDYTALEWEDRGAAFMDINGHEFIDCLGGYGMFNCGHRHPKIMKALADQLNRQALSSQELLDPFRGKLAEILAEATPGDLQYAFFTNSGTESVEATLKLARLHTGRTGIISTIGAFHGKSMGSLSATSKAMFREPFLPLVPGFHHVPYGDAEAVEKRIKTCSYTGNDIAAVILEPIQGEGGVNVPYQGYLRDVRDICDRHGVLLIFDEVQTGMGRTGELWCCDHEDVAPDLMALGKAFGGGVMPIGAVAGTKEVWQRWTPNPFLHSTTFGGNPMGCAAAIAAFDVIFEEGLCEKAAWNGSYFMEGIRKIGENYPDLFQEVRGKGLLIGMEFMSNEKGYAVASGLFKRGVLVAGTMINSKTIRVEPPLVISREVIDRVLEIFDDTLEAVRSGQ